MMLVRALPSVEFHGKDDPSTEFPVQLSLFGILHFFSEDYPFSSEEHFKDLIRDYPKGILTFCNDGQRKEDRGEEAALCTLHLKSDETGRWRTMALETATMDGAGSRLAGRLACSHA